MSWPFLVRPTDDPGTVGLLSLRLQTTWLGTPDTSDGGARGAPTAAPTATSPSPEGFNESWDRDQAGGGREGPVQWHADKAVDFIQVGKRRGRDESAPLFVFLFSSYFFGFCFVLVLPSSINRVVAAPLEVTVRCGARTRATSSTTAAGTVTVATTTIATITLLRLQSRLGDRPMKF